MLNIGVAEVNITPEPGYPLGGYAERYFLKNRAIGKLNDLFARAIYISDGENEALLISAEILAFENNYVKEIKEKISEVTDLNKEQVILTATHTHSAPDVMLDMILFRDLLREEDFKLIRRYREFLLRKLVDVANNARRNAVQQDVFVNMIKIKDYCSNRINPLAEKDEDALILTDRRHWAVINLICHPTVLGASNLMYSGDFLSYAAIELRKEIQKNITPIFLIGAAGDQSTRFVRKNQSPEEAERIGRKVASKLIEGIRDARKAEIDKIEITTTEINLPRRDMSEIEGKLRTKIKELEKALESNIEQAMKRKLNQDLMTAKIILNNLDKFKAYIQEYPKEIGIKSKILKMNDTLLIFLPLELACKYGLELKKEAKNRTISIITYADGYYGYLPTKEAYQALDYEALMTPFSENAGTLLISQLVRILN